MSKRSEQLSLQIRYMNDQYYYEKMFNSPLVIREPQITIKYHLHPLGWLDSQGQ